MDFSFFLPSLTDDSSRQQVSAAMAVPSPSRPPANKPIGMACRACRLRKIRCGGERPRCTYCVKKGYECVLTPHKKRGRPRKSQQATIPNDDSQEEEPMMAEPSMTMPADAPLPSDAFLGDLDVRRLWAELTGSGIQDLELPAELSALADNLVPGEPAGNVPYIGPSFNLGVTDTAVGGDPLQLFSGNYAFPMFDPGNSAMDMSSSAPSSATQPAFGFMPFNQPPFLPHSVDAKSMTPGSLADEHRAQKPPRMESPGSAASSINMGKQPAGFSVDAGVRQYFTYVHPWMPILHRPTFERQIAEGTVDPLLFYCVQAIAARFSEADSTRKPYKRGQRFARAARRLLPTSLKAATLTTLQSITLLSLYMSVSGQWQAGAAYERLAVQLAFVGQYHLLDEEFLLPPVTNNLGLYESGWSEHSHPARLEVLSRPGGILDHEQRRRAWWSVFQLERFNGLAMGRPPIIKPGWHWVWLPCAEDLWARENPSGPLASEMGLATDSLAQRPVASMSSVARVDLVLALIMGQIIEQRTDMFRLFFPRVDKGTLFHDNLATHEMDWPQRLSRLGEAVGALERRIRQWHTELGRKYADHVSARRQANLEIMGASCQIHVLACVLQIREHLFEDLLISEEVKDALGKSVGTPGMVSGTQTPTGELSQSSSGLDLSALFEGHNGSAFDRSVYQRGYMARAKRPPLTQQFVSDFDALAQKCWDRAVAMSDEIARLVRVHWLDTNGGESGGVFGNDEEEESGEIVVERFRLMNPQTPYHLFVAGKVQAARLKQAVTARTGRERMEVDDSDVVKDAIHRINDIWDKHAITADPRAIESRLDDIISALEHSQRIWFSLNFASHLRYLKHEARKPLLQSIYRE